ncbi:uncharacterized protein PHALS_07861 [Plasmopara halstedii]|uniref:Uncharacterized protein n=1 Tax=Plasmopara halstedii TaxID=4781 RepID=A0A0P1B894_PLAHL|nr:uncharacterized protein PHALS_07861 [Plasmopara halstedii]CEG50136.1 hypothetical protein PHALS_07861 [Plasmopara halstedii]|eukprot:XP_024586505.1 hypothetical protein PHALS_07861 [Plasmopara halstedii]
MSVEVVYVQVVRRNLGITLIVFYESTGLFNPISTFLRLLLPGLRRSRRIVKSFA